MKNINFCYNYIDLPDFLKLRIKESNIFFTEAYEKNVKKRKQNLIYIWSDCNILVIRIKKVLFLQAGVLETEPFFYADSFNKDENFLNEAMEILKKLGIQWVVCSTTARFQNYPYNCKVVPCGNFILDLKLSVEELWKNVHSKHRNSIRRGEKNNLELKIGGLELIDEYILISNETYKRSGILDGDNNYYKNLINGLENNSNVFLVYKNGELQAGGLFYYNSSIAYYLHGASKSHPEPGSANYLLWKSILYFKEKRVSKFSFVGYRYNPEPNSKLEGIQRFKERFGGELEKSYNFRYEQNKIAYSIFCFIMKLKQKKLFQKYRDAVDEQLYKYPELNRGNYK